MTRRSRDELRSLMLEAGCELVRRRGLAFDPPSLTYSKVFQHLDETKDIRLHRSQVHGRIWESQDHYRTEVVVRTIREVLPTSADIDVRVADFTRNASVDNLQDLVEGWMAASSSNSRTTVDGDLGVDLFVAAHALSQQDSATSAVVTAEATAQLNELTRANESRYDAAATEFGLEFANDLGIDRSTAISLPARTASGLMEGTRLMESLDGSSTEPLKTLDSAGNRQDVDAATLGMVLFVEQILGLGHA